MDRSQYPALANSGIIHFDASAAFPLHAEVIAAVEGAMSHLLGTPGKAQYQGAMDATAIADDVRLHIAGFINADVSEIFLVSSATEAARYVAETWGAEGRVVYSAEDHSRIGYELAKRCHDTYTFAYAANGQCDYDALQSFAPDVAVVSHIHHLYGIENDLKKMRNILPNSTIIVDASQSASRIPIDVKQLNVDALFFSAQKIGGLAGIGVLYVANNQPGMHIREQIEANTLPIVPLVSLGSAIDVISGVGFDKITRCLSELTRELIGLLEDLPNVEFVKATVYQASQSLNRGIVSFSVAGYSSQDVAAILDLHAINVRAGDHCVNPAAVNRDVVRVSIHMYNSTQEIRKFAEIIKSL